MLRQAGLYKKQCASGWGIGPLRMVTGLVLCWNLPSYLLHTAIWITKQRLKWQPLDWASISVFPKLKAFVGSNQCTERRDFTLSLILTWKCPQLNTFCPHEVGYVRTRLGWGGSSLCYHSTIPPRGHSFFHALQRGTGLNNPGLAWSSICLACLCKRLGVKLHVGMRLYLSVFAW